MKYPYRIVIKYGTKTPKLATIQYVNHFLNHDALGEYEKWNVVDSLMNGGHLKGIEIGFADKRDAIHFKLGFNQDGQEISSKNLGADREEKERV